MNPAALAIDYGAEHGFRDSLRGIRDHKFVNPLSDPGLVDLVRCFATLPPVCPLPFLFVFLTPYSWNA